MSRQTVAEAMVDTLEAAGVKRIYGAPETRSMA
jgi:thiamine pyrophosphate-dependent acetolactate synthase large subunit-like protein